jgi:peptide/nickel transport system permease protein
VTGSAAAARELPTERELRRELTASGTARRELWAGGLLVALFVVLAILASLFHDQAYVARPALAYRPPFWDAHGSFADLLGTDSLGRDVAARLLYGIRVSVLIAAASVLIAGVVGVALGEIAGFVGGWIDDIIMRVSDGFLAIPVILLAISFVGAAGPSLTALVVVLAGTQWMLFARVARGETLVVREQQFVVAQRAMGAGNRRILFRHIVPHVLPSALVVATLNVPTVILLEAGLDFLGLGVQPPTPSLGGMISDGLLTITAHPLLAIYPGVVLMILVVAINMLGDGVKTALAGRTL